MNSKNYESMSVAELRKICSKLGVSNSDGRNKRDKLLEDIKTYNTQAKVYLEKIEEYEKLWGCSVFEKIDLTKKSVVDLREIASKMRVRGFQHSRKKELIQKIKDAVNIEALVFKYYEARRIALSERGGLRAESVCKKEIEVRKARETKAQKAKRREEARARAEAEEEECRRVERERQAVIDKIEVPKKLSKRDHYNKLYGLIRKGTITEEQKEVYEKLREEIFGKREPKVEKLKVEKPILPPASPPKQISEADQQQLEVLKNKIAYFDNRKSELLQKYGVSHTYRDGELIGEFIPWFYRGHIKPEELEKGACEYLECVSKLTDLRKQESRLEIKLGLVEGVPVYFKTSRKKENAAFL